MGKHKGRKAFYMAGTMYSGCGHEHKTRKAAVRCARLTNRNHPLISRRYWFKVYRITFPRGVWTYKQVWLERVKEGR
jgi:hypothetical protein